MGALAEATAREADRGSSSARNRMPLMDECELFDGRWIRPDATECRQEDYQFHDYDYVGVAARSETERYIAWFRAANYSGPPVYEEFYTYARSDATVTPFEDADQTNVVGEHRARADALLGRVKVLWEEYAAFSE